MPKPSLPRVNKLSRATAGALSRQLASDFPNQIDVHVGNRLRVRRMLTGLTQDELAAAVGITFQQVQKYEKGANRISASRLYAFSHVLKVRVGWFFEDLDEPGKVDLPLAADAPPSDSDMMETREALELIGAYWRICAPGQREALLQLIRSVSG